MWRLSLKIVCLPSRFFRANVPHDIALSSTLAAVARQCPHGGVCFQVDSYVVVSKGRALALRMTTPVAAAVVVVVACPSPSGIVRIVGPVVTTCQSAERVGIASIPAVVVITVVVVVPVVVVVVVVIATGPAALPTSLLVVPSLRTEAPSHLGGGRGGS
eukprot:scaffold1558_cov403-Prasinococcus_capsulatus_cf.AAC.5